MTRKEKILNELINETPMKAAKMLTELAQTDTDLQDYLEDWHTDWFENDSPHPTMFDLIQKWFESDEAGDTEKWEAIATWFESDEAGDTEKWEMIARWAEYTPRGREIIRLTAKEIYPELFIRPQLETGDTTLADTYRTELLQKIADNHSTQELEKLAGI